MSTLHIVSRQLDATTLASLQRSLNEGDILLLSCDGVYLALRPGFALPCVALACDVEARGLQALWPEGIAQIDHAGWVELSLYHPKSLSWA